MASRKGTEQNDNQACRDSARRREVEEIFGRLGGRWSESCIIRLRRNGARPINKDAVAETAGGATGLLKHLLK